MARRVTAKLRKAIEKVQMERDRIEMTAVNTLLATSGEQGRGRRDTRSFVMPDRTLRRRSFRSILCPVDFSRHSRAALRYARAIARRSGGRLIVLFVNDPLLVAAAAAAHDARALAQTSRKELRRFVAASLGPSEKKSAATLVASIGKPAREINRFAKRSRCDLIVMGSQGLSGASKLFFGSTTEAVLQRTEVPVLAVPPLARGGRPRAALLGSWPGRRVVAPVDLGEHAEADASRAAAAARLLGTELLLLHVVSAVRPPPWYRPDIVAHQRIGVAKALRRLEALQAGIADVAKACQVVVGNPADEVSALAAERRAGLVILTLRPRAGIFGSRTGSIAYHVLCHATAPVLALPTRWRARPPGVRRG